jgi:uroporphyrin-III C-methyltransferase/precorrin-2 dehydrogenase/sirohydrochlorin ferrochelatase
MYPVMLDVKGRSCLVVGGGGVALRKVEGLLSEGGDVTVVSPRVIDPLKELADRGEISLIQRPYRDGEVADYALGFATTNDREVNTQVYVDAVAAGVWVNVADVPELCTFYLPARIKRGTLQLTLASTGGAPFAVRRLRQVFDRLLGSEWSEWIEAASRFRDTLRKRIPEPVRREKAFDRFFNSTVDARRLVVHVPGEKEMEAWLPGDEGVSGSAQVRESSHWKVDKEAPESGYVSLVGAGPGDAGLLTVKGRQRLLSADAVVYDHLAETVIPCDLNRDVELHPVGKKAGYHPVPQEEINHLLIRLAQQGKRVARLKGGDPYVFGRGGEEAQALQEAGIPFEVIPCVTAATAVPGYAGIPVTHRQEVVTVSLVTAHESSKEGGPQIRWDLLAQDKHSTLVGYMGVTSLPETVNRLLTAGMDPETPSAMIERGTTSRQRVVRARVVDLPGAVLRSGIRPPALFVIGPAVRHAEQLDWFGSRPLLGERILVPSGGEQSVVDALEVSGVEVIEVPLPVGPAARIVVSAAPLTGCILQTADEVEALEDERAIRNWGSEVVAYCLDEGAAAKARELGWACVEEVLDTPTAEELVRRMGIRRVEAQRNSSME